VHEEEGRPFPLGQDADGAIANRNVLHDASLSSCWVLPVLGRRQQVKLYASRAAGAGRRRQPARWTIYLPL
jgi:hypothetical protein